MTLQKFSFLLVPLAAGPFLLFSRGDEPTSIMKKGLDTIHAEEAMVHVKYLASKELEGRDTGDPGCEKAAEYLVKQYEKIGLEPFGDVKDGKRTYLQQYPITVGQMDPASGIQVEGAGGKLRTLALGKDVRGLSFSYPVDVKNDTPVVDAGKITIKAEPQPETASRAQRKRANIELPDSVKGSFVILRIQDFGGLNNSELHSSIATALKEKGGAGALLADGGAADFSERFEKSSVWGSRRSKRQGKPDNSEDGLRRSNNPPILILSNAEAANSLVESKIKFILKSEAKEYYATNVVGLLKGSDAEKSKEYVVHSAHYDHVGMQGGTIHPGADDNASGTSCLLETAQAYKSAGAPKRSIIFLLVSGEEHGLWGSDFFVKNPPVSLESMIADINTDMVGRTLINGAQKPEYMMMTPNPKNKDFNTLAARSIELSGMYGFPNMADGDIYWQRSDHYNFAKNKIPTMFLCNGEHEDYHRPGDTWDKIDGGKIERSAKLAFHLGYETAMADEKPKLTGAQKAKDSKAAPKTDDKKDK